MTIVSMVLVAALGSVAVLVGRDGSPTWQLVRAATVGVVAAGAVAFLRPPAAPTRAWLAAVLGVVVSAVGVGFLPYIAKEPLSLESAAAIVAVTGGVALAVIGTSRGTRGLARLPRAATCAAMFAATVLVVMAVAPAVAATNVPRPGIEATPSSVGLHHEDAILRTSDGVELAAWYIPSTNGAAVVLRHGAGSTRSDVLPEAVVLTRHGFGVLMTDARGHGQSGGRAMDFGWHGDGDIAAATSFLADRSDVDPRRIAVVGSSMGGEEAIGASASDGLIRAVVAEGATGRVAEDKAWLSEEYGVRGLFQEQVEHVQYWLADQLTSARRPIALRSAVRRSRGTAYLLITAGNVPDEADAAAYIAGGAPDRVQTWDVPGASHTDGLGVAPEDWEHRVVTFLGDALHVET